MSMLQRCLFLVVLGLVIVVGNETSSACTIAVANGSVTADGRPLLWKNRDINNVNRSDQEVRYFDDGLFGGYLSLVSTGLDETTTSYVGLNDVGFAIMNSVSPDLAGGSPSSHGILMKLALQNCESVDDFETLLIDTAGSRGNIWANFGVIDRFGNATLFEATDDDYRRYDAADHGGFIVRANNSVWGGGELGPRYERASLLIGDAVSSGQLSYGFLIQNVARDLGGAPSLPCGQWPTIEPAINRHQTRSSVVVHGVLPDENPALSTFWCTLGEPSCGFSVPLWSKAGTPSTLILDPGQQAAVCGAIQARELTCYDALSGDTTIDTEALVGSDGSGGIYGYSLPLEDETFLDTEARLALWRQSPPTNAQMAQFQNERSARSYHYFNQETAPLPASLAPVSNVAATPGHEQITLTWQDPVDEFTRVEIWRSRWNDEAGSSVYPLYQQHPTNVYPQRPQGRAQAQTTAQWELVGEALPGAESFTSEVAPRGVYCFELFVVDEGFNSSSPTTEMVTATNYWLGDFRADDGGPPDGWISVADMTLLGTVFGLDDLDSEFVDSCDVGPTDTWSRLGIPQPDGFINFEDLMICSLNFGLAEPDKVAPPAASAPTLVWNRLPDGDWALQLVQPCPQLKGLHLVSSQAAGVPGFSYRGDLLANQSATVVVWDTQANGLDLSLAVLGVETGLIGQGELLRLPGGFRPEDISIEARNLQNLGLSVDLIEPGQSSNTPALLSLSGNHPNPFNPQTTIAFTLWQPAHVVVDICTLSGRLVANLINDPQSAGEHEVVWSGKDEQGRAVASGIYLYRVQAGEMEKTGRMCLVR